MVVNSGLYHRIQPAVRKPESQGVYLRTRSSSRATLEQGGRQESALRRYATVWWYSPRPPLRSLTTYGPLFSPSFLRHGPAPERMDHDVVRADCVLLYSVLVVQCLHAGSCLTLLQARPCSGSSPARPRRRHRT